MKRHIIPALTVVLIGAGLLFAQTQLFGPPAPNNTYFSALDATTGLVRPLIGIDTSGQVSIDPDGIGLVFTSGSSGTPSLAFGDGDSGLYEFADDNVRLNLAGTDQWGFTGTTMYAAAGAGVGLRNVTPTATVANIHPDQDDTDTGLGLAAADALSLIAGGVEGIRITESGGAIELDLNGTPQFQGPIIEAIFCGDLGNGTVYTSPVSGYPAAIFYASTTAAADLSYALAGDGCAAQDNATEATADEIMFANNALEVLGFYCTVTGSGSNGVTLSMRSAEAALTPAVSVTIATTDTTEAANTVTTTDIAAGATVAVAAVSTEDLGAQDFWCLAKLMVVPN